MRRISLPLRIAHVPSRNLIVIKFCFIPEVASGDRNRIIGGKAEDARRWLMNEKFTNPGEIIQLNIEHYSNLLKTPLAEQTRLTVEGLLAVEKAKLADGIKHRADPGECKPADRCGAGKLR